MNIKIDERQFKNMGLGLVVMIILISSSVALLDDRIDTDLLVPIYAIVLGFILGVGMCFWGIKRLGEKQEIEKMEKENLKNLHNSLKHQP